MEGRKNFIKLYCVLLPRAIQVILKKFYNCWQRCNHKWKHSTDQGLLFINTKGKELYARATRRQKEMLEQGNANLWDLKLLIAILQNIDFGLVTNEKVCESVRLKQLLEIRNEINSIPNCWIENEKFSSIWDKLSDILIQFGDSPEELCALKCSDTFCEYNKNEELTDVVNTLRAKGFKEVANAFYKDGKYNEAIESYSEAINLQLLPIDDLSTLYSNRSAVYMVAIDTKAISNDKIRLAKDDAKRALLLRPLWFRAHYRLGCTYRWLKKYQKAIKHFDVALTLEPDHEEINEELNLCKIKSREEKFSDSVYPEKLPENEEEMAEEISRQFGARMSQEFFLAMEERLKKLGDPRPIVWQAHRFLSGCSVDQNYSRAAEFYSKAAQMGNAEALYNLAILYRDGKGVKRDTKLCVKYLRQAANKPRVIEGARNVGVAEAEFALGRAYEKGLGVAADLPLAISWYTKSSEHGNKHAANTLACFHFYGKGVVKSEEKAVHFWKLAATRHNVIAMQSLANYYLENENDLDKAMHWHHKAIANGNLIAKSISTGFEARVKSIQAEIAEQRKAPPRVASVVSGQQMDHTDMSEAVTKSDGAKQEVACYDIAILDQYSTKGSLTAKLIKDAIIHFSKAYNLLQYKTAFASVVIPELANCIRICEKVISWDVDTKNTALALVSRTLRLMPKTEVCQLDQDARICHIALFDLSLQKTVAFLEESMKKYPGEVWFYIVLCNLLGMTKENEKGVKETLKALEKFPLNCDLLFTRACHLQALKPSFGNTQRNSQEIIAAYEQFLAIAPPDHRKVPQAYYSIALEYLLSSEKQLSNEKQERTIRLIGKYYKLGIQAETIQLPFYLPYTCEKKTYLETVPNLKSFLSKSDIQIVHNATTTYWSPRDAFINELQQNHLTEMHRITIIREHREMVAEIRSPVEDGVQFENQFKPRVIGNYQPIILKNMDPLHAKPYNGWSLQVTVIEDPLLGFSAVHLIVEDSEGNAERLCLYNFPEDQDIHDKVGLGCMLKLLNPFYKIATDGKGLLQVDDMESVVFDKKQHQARCQFCWKSEAGLKCGRCLRSVYCSKECQINDWTVLKHRLICIKD